MRRTTSKREELDFADEKSLDRPDIGDLHLPPPAPHIIHGKQFVAAKQDQPPFPGANERS